MGKNNIENLEEIENIDSLLKVSKNSRMFYLICIFFISLLLIIFWLLLFNNNSNISKSKIKIDEDALILIKENDKYGYINTKGKKVIDAKYESADKFIGNYTKVYDGNNYMIIDTQGNVKYKSEKASDIMFISDYNIWIINDNLYDYNLKKLNDKNTTVRYIDKGYLKWINEKSNKAGIINYKGKVTYTYKLQKDEKNFYFNEIGNQNDKIDDYEYCVVSIDNKKYGIINCGTGKTIYDFTDNTISKKISSCFEIKNIKNYSFVERIIIINNKVVYKTDDKSELIYNYDNYFNIYSSKKRNNYYISKIDGKEYLSEPQSNEKFDTRTDLEKELNIEKIKCDDGFGLKKNNKVKLKCKYKELLYFDDDVMRYLDYKNRHYVIVLEDYEYKLIDYNNGKVITTFDTYRLGLLDGSLFIEYNSKNNDKKYVYSILKNKTSEFNLDDKISINSNYFTIKNDDKLNYYNVDMKKIYTN